MEANSTKCRRHQFLADSNVILSVAERSFMNFYEESACTGSCEDMSVRRFVTMPDDYKLPETVSYPPTTLMLRNIPSKFDQESLIKVLNERSFVACRHFDFIYLPIDLRTRKNLGYAFINFTSAAIAEDFTAQLSNVKLKAQSEKTLSIGLAKLQGLTQNCDLFATSASVATMPGIYQPLVFSEAEGCLVPLSVALKLPKVPEPPELSAGFARLVQTTWSLLG